MTYNVFSGTLNPTQSINQSTLQISAGFTSWQRYCTALQYWASAKLCGIEQRAPPIFGRAAITLDIGPYF